MKLSISHAYDPVHLIRLAHHSTLGVLPLVGHRVVDLDGVLGWRLSPGPDEGGEAQ